MINKTNTKHSACMQNTLFWVLRIGEASLFWLLVSTWTHWWPCKQIVTWPEPSAILCRPAWSPPQVRNQSRSLEPSTHPQLSCAPAVRDQGISICTRGSIFQLPPWEIEFRDTWLAQLLGAAVSSARTAVSEHVHLLLRRTRTYNESKWNLIGWFVHGSHVLIGWQGCWFAKARKGKINEEATLEEAGVAP